MFRSHAAVVSQLLHRRQRLLKRGKTPLLESFLPTIIITRMSFRHTPRGLASFIRGWKAPVLLCRVSSVPPLLAAVCFSVLRWLLYCAYSRGLLLYTGILNSASKRAPMSVSPSVSSHRAMSFAMVAGESDA